MEQLNYKLDLFEGPLDLLLSLVEKNKINIDDIPISLLCQQYMEYIAAAQAMDIDLSADFLIMASELMLIKSKMLLPRDPAEEEDPRAALAAAMLEYQRTKRAAASFAEMFSTYGGRMVKDTDEIKADNAEIAPHDAALLTRALMRLLSEVRISDEEIISRFDPLLSRPVVSVADAAATLLSRFRIHPTIPLRSLFVSLPSRSERIAAFMAILELLKSGAILLTEEEYASDGVIRTSDTLSLSWNPETDMEETARNFREATNF